jgi:hypothetical protein
MIQEVASEPWQTGFSEVFEDTVSDATGGGYDNGCH